LLSDLKLPLTVNAGTETERRPFLHVSDATGALMFLQSRRESKGQIYNVAGENASTEEVVDIIKHMIPSTRVTYVKRPYDAPLSYEYNTSKIYNLGFQTHHNLREGITELVDLFSGFFQVN
jgi:nucleoside-diphosphate-sugar epimerase